MAGVVIPEGQFRDADDRGAPMSVAHAVPGFMCPVKYYDKLGKPHSEFFFVVGDMVYKDPNGEAWASSLKVVSDDIAQQVRTSFNQALKAQIRSVIQEELRGESAATVLTDLDLASHAVDNEVLNVQAAEEASA